MPAYTFNVDTRFEWRNVIWRVVRRLPEQKINIENTNTMEVRTESIEELQSALFNGALQFAPPERPANSPLPIIDHRMIFEDYDPVLRAIAEFRKQVILPLLGLSPRRRKDVKHRVEEVLALLEAKKMPIQHMNLSRDPVLKVSVTTLFRWIKSYVESDFDMRALVPNTKKQGKQKGQAFPEEVEKIIIDVIEKKALSRMMYTIDDIHDEIVLQIHEKNFARVKPLETPSRSTIARRLEKVGLQERFAARRGEREENREAAQYKRIPRPDRPLSRVEIDHTPIDLIVVDEATSARLGRPTLTLCIDVCTRMPLGYYLGFEPSSFAAVRECLYHAIMPKRTDLQEKYNLKNSWVAFGIPEVVVVDNGNEFKGHDLGYACQELGIIIEETPSNAPEFKAFVERQFKTLNTGLFKKLPGATFSNPMERGDYDSVSEAKLTLSQLDQIIHLFFVDLYAQQYHKGIRSIPARRWEAYLEGGFHPRLPFSSERLSILLSATKERIIHQYGIELHSLRYNCINLSLLRRKLKGSKTKIKYHPNDLSHLYAYDPFENEYIYVPALMPNYTSGLSLWMHRVIQRNAAENRDEVDQIALAQTKREIEELVKSNLKKGNNKTNKSSARWLTAGASAQNQEQASGDMQSGNDLPDMPKQTLKLDFTPEEMADLGLSIDNPDAKDSSANEEEQGDVRE